VSDLTRKALQVAVDAYRESQSAEREYREMRAAIRKLDRVVNEAELAEVHRIQDRLNAARENAPGTYLLVAAAERLLQQRPATCAERWKAMDPDDVPGDFSRGYRAAERRLLLADEGEEG
jgi:hypothetical protein